MASTQPSRVTDVQCGISSIVSCVSGKTMEGPSRMSPSRIDVPLIDRTRGMSNAIFAGTRSARARNRPCGSARLTGAGPARREGTGMNAKVRMWAVSGSRHSGSGWLRVAGPCDHRPMLARQACPEGRRLSGGHARRGRRTSRHQGRLGHAETPVRTVRTTWARSSAWRHHAPAGRDAPSAVLPARPPMPGQGPRRVAAASYAAGSRRTRWIGARVGHLGTTHRRSRQAGAGPRAAILVARHGRRVSHDDGRPVPVLASFD